MASRASWLELRDSMPTNSFGCWQLGIFCCMLRDAAMRRLLLLFCSGIHIPENAAYAVRKHMAA
jgi:hypothetical protein